jgi:dihydropteroate synthase
MISAFSPSPNLPRGLGDGDLAGRLYVLPMGMVSGAAAAAAIVAGNGWPIAEGGLAFTAAGICLRERGRTFVAVAPFAELVEWAEGEGEAVARHVSRLIHAIGRRRADWGGIAMDRPRIMGIVNTTPDSFSDGGENLDPAIAVDHGLAMVAAGADIVDVGGESTRPGAAPVSEDEEMVRVLPVVRALAEKGVVVSIDTRHARIMAAATEAGARIINDITALQGDGAVAVAARSGAAICLMHMQGEPRNMQADPVYDCAPLDVYDHLAERVQACQEAGIGLDRLCVDPGIGFGKSVDHNAQILASLALYHGLACPVLLGASRKSFIARMSKGEGARDRLGGTLAAHLAGLGAGVQIIRVHDVPETVQAVAVWRAMS